MFTWGASPEIVDAEIPITLKTLPGLKKGRTRAREIERVKPVEDEVIWLFRQKWLPTWFGCNA